MTDELVLGVDVGTYETKGVIVDATGHVRATAVRGHRMSIPAPGWAEHDPESVWWDGFVTVVREMLARDGMRADAIKAVGVSGIGPCVLPVDASGRPLRPAILYGVDTRATAEIESLERTLGVDEILAVTGNRLSTQSAGPKIAWLRQNEPEVLNAAWRIVTSQSFLVGRLTGRWVIDHGTAGYFHPLYDLARRRWYEPWCERIVRPEQLPELGWAGDVAGTVTADAADATGLCAGTSVTVGTADAPAEAVNAGITKPGLMMIMYGSTIFMIEMLDRPVNSGVLWSAPYVFPGSYVLAGSTFTAGTVTCWFRDLVGLDPERPPSFELLTEEAANSPPGARGLLVLPFFSGHRGDPGARGVIAGLDLTHGRGDVFRAILEGIAQDVRRNLDIYRELRATPEGIRAVGGGTRNGVWTQAVSDCTGREQLIVTGTGASYGDAAIAALSVGLLDGRESLDNWVRIEQRVEPDPELAALYEGQRARAEQLYRGTRHLVGSESLSSAL